MKVRKSGAIEVIMIVMKIHINNAVICERGCGIFMNITENGKLLVNKKNLQITTPGDNQVKMGECGAIDVIVKALKIHTSDPIVYKYGCCTLLNTTLNNCIFI